MTPPGIEPATFRFVAQYLNHCATRSKVEVITEITYVRIPQSIQKAYTNWDYSNSSAHSLSELVENRTVLATRINTRYKTIIFRTVPILITHLTTSTEWNRQCIARKGCSLTHGLLRTKNSAKWIAMTDESTRNFSFFADRTATLILPYQTDYIM
jgi:hypothetical protein